MWISPDDKGKGVSGCKGLGAGQDNGRAGRAQAVPDGGSNDMWGPMRSGLPGPPLSGHARFGAIFQPSGRPADRIYDADVPEFLR